MYYVERTVVASIAARLASYTGKISSKRKTNLLDLDVGRFEGRIKTQTVFSGEDKLSIYTPIIYYHTYSYKVATSLRTFR